MIFYFKKEKYTKLYKHDTITLLLFFEYSTK